MSTLSPRSARTVAVLADRKSTRLNSSHSQISYAVFCLKKKKTQELPDGVAVLQQVQRAHPCNRLRPPPFLHAALHTPVHMLIDVHPDTIHLVMTRSRSL